MDVWTHTDCAHAVLWFENIDTSLHGSGAVLNLRLDCRWESRSDSVVVSAEPTTSMDQLVDVLQGEVMNARAAAEQASLIACHRRRNTTRVLGKPKIFDDRSDIWRQSKFTLLGYAGAVDSRLKQAAIESEVLIESAITNGALLPRAQRVSTQLFCMLVLLLEGSAKRLLEHAGDGEGLLSWHRFVHFRGLFAAPSRCNIDVHHSKRHALFNADKSWFLHQRWVDHNENGKAKQARIPQVSCFISRCFVFVCSETVVRPFSMSVACYHLRIQATAQFGVTAILTSIFDAARRRWSRAQLHGPRWKIVPHRAQIATWVQNECTRDTIQLPRRVIAQRCAAPSRSPSAAFATTASSLRAANPAWSRLVGSPCFGLSSVRKRRVLPRNGPFLPWECVNTGVSSQMKLHGFGVTSRRVGVKNLKICGVLTYLLDGKHKLNKKPNIDDVHLDVGLLLSVRQSKDQKIWCPKHEELKNASDQTSPEQTNSQYHQERRRPLRVCPNSRDRLQWLCHFRKLACGNIRKELLVLSAENQRTWLTARPPPSEYSRTLATSPRPTTKLFAKKTKAFPFPKRGSHATVSAPPTFLEHGVRVTEVSIELQLPLPTTHTIFSKLAAARRVSHWCFFWYDRSVVLALINHTSANSHFMQRMTIFSHSTSDKSNGTFGWHLPTLIFV